jgi:hypothetical protein
LSANIKHNVLFIVRALPYESSGTPVVIRNLLNFLPSENYFVLGRTPDPKKRLPNNVKQKMVGIPILYTKGHRFWKYYSIVPGLLIGVWMIRKYKITKIIGVFQDDASLKLAYLLALIFPKIEFYPYLMDLYAEQKDEREIERAKLRQNKIFTRAKKVLVVNDGMKEFLEPLYTLTQFVSIPIISQSHKIELNERRTEKINDFFVIVFSGSVNEDRLEPFRVLAKVAAADKRFLIRFLTNQSEENLRNLGVYHDGFQLKYCQTPEDLMFELNQADVLYLPLKFSFPESKKAQMITCFGAKVYDYMLTSVPMLIHAPNYVYNYTFLEENDASFLLDTLDEARVRSMLEYLLINARNEVGKRKYNQANQVAQQFKGEIVSQKFILTLNSNV